MELLSGSSDPIVLDAGLRSPPAIGPEVRFQFNYSALLRAMTSPFVAKGISEDYGNIGNGLAGPTAAFAQPDGLDG